MLKYPDFFQIPRIVAINPKLQDKDKMVYAAIYWLERLKDGVCTAKNETIAEIIGTENAISIANSLARLEEQGCILRIFHDEAKRNRKEIKCLIVYGKVSPRHYRQLSSVGDTLSSVGDTASPIRLSPLDEQNKNNKKSKEEGDFSSYEKEYEEIEKRQTTEEKERIKEKMSGISEMLKPLQAL